MEKFYAYLLDLLHGYSHLAELLTDKLDAIDSFDLDALDSILKEEQRYVLIARGFDGQVKNHKDRLGVVGDTLGAVIAELPGQERPRFQALFVDLKEKLDEVKNLNQKCQDLTTAKMIHIEASLRRLEGTTDYRPKPQMEKGAAPAPQILSKWV